MSAMVSWGRIRRALQPLVLKYWFKPRSLASVVTRVEGFELTVFPTVFHPRYFGSSSILARFVSSLDLGEKKFLDIGCGSGLLAMCAARRGADVTAVDINPEAVRCSLANAARYGLDIDARVSDLFSSLDGARFDVIAWNPPFLPGIPSTAAEAAFYGGPRLDLIRKFAAEVHDHLMPGASIYTILTADADVAGIEMLFREQGFTVSRVRSRRWGLRETMVILWARKTHIDR
jgi:release factor glutamine methyltransferase